MTHGSAIVSSEPAHKAKQPAPPNQLEPKLKPWEHQPFENDLWFERFLHYLKLGPRRSVSLAATGKRNAYPLPSHWMIVAKEHLWRERAYAYDKAHGLIEELDADREEQPLT